MKVTRKLCNGRDYIFNGKHTVKTRPMLMKIFISRLCIVENMSFVVRESVTVPILFGKYKGFLSDVLVP